MTPHRPLKAKTMESSSTSAPAASTGPVITPPSMPMSAIVASPAAVPSPTPVDSTPVGPLPVQDLASPATLLSAPAPATLHTSQQVLAPGAPDTPPSVPAVAPVISSMVVSNAPQAALEVSTRFKLTFSLILIVLQNIDVPEVIAPRPDFKSRIAFLHKGKGKAVRVRSRSSSEEH